MVAATLFREHDMSTTAPRFHVPGRNRRVQGALPNRVAALAAALLWLALCLCNAAVAAPQAGWWWNPAESGRGFFIESQGGIFYMAAYLYADDGRARWLVAGGPNADPYHYTGRLLAYANGTLLCNDTATTQMYTLSLHDALTI